MGRLFEVALIAAVATIPMTCVVAADGTVPAQTVGQALVDARHTLVARSGALDGDGAPILRQAIAGARYVAVGEDHVTREIPAFVSALCDAMAPQQLSALVLEVGPATARTLAPILRSKDRIERMTEFNRAYPNAVAFLDTAADNDMAAHCLSSDTTRLVGIDQEFIGAAGLLLDQMLATSLTPSTKVAVQALRDRERAAVAAARKTGDPSSLLMLAAAPSDLDAVQGALATGGSPEAVRLFDELRTSHDIYRLNAIGDPDANGSRARLMKRNLSRTLPATGKVLLKFGDWHLYKGINPLGNRDIGNFIAERSEGEGSQSLHILVLGARGTHATFAGFSKPLKQQAFQMFDDPDYHWLKLATERQVDGGWTLFDLRTLRHRSLSGLDSDWTRVIDGYDLMVVIPELTPSAVIGQK